jgi:hypothetical protein
MNEMDRSAINRIRGGKAQKFSVGRGNRLLDLRVNEISTVRFTGEVRAALRQIVVHLCEGIVRIDRRSIRIAGDVTVECRSNNRIRPHRRGTAQHCQPDHCGSKQGETF